jgi:ABC-type glycerol-3-phosphate transport system substrate-binding protein
MMKKGIRLLALVLAGVLMTGCFTGCGKKTSEKEGTSSTDIQISYWNAGLGREWLDKIIEAFNEKYPEYHAYCNATADGQAAYAAFGLEDTDTVDLYMALKQYDDNYMEPLNDVLDSTVKGESKSIKEKFDPSYLALEEKNGNYYQLTYGGGLVSFVYNPELFEEAGIKQLPRTTDELAVVCSTLNDNNIEALCHFVGGGYYHFVDEVWFAQYEGLDAYYDFYQKPSKERMMTKDGRYKVLEVLEKILTPEYVLQGSNAETHVSMQTKFLEGRAAMMINGSWLSSEMLNSDKVDKFMMMKTPVISSITDKLDTVKGDQQLRKLITAIDNVTDGVKKEEEYKDGENYNVDGQIVSAKDWQYVKQARNMIAKNYSGETCYIPTYSNAKEGAKEFLKFFYSDEGYQIYLDSLNIKMPFSLSEGEIDTSKWNSFLQNQAELMDSVEYVIAASMMNKHAIFAYGGADSFGTKNYNFHALMCSTNETDRINAEKAWQHISNLINDKYDNDWMKNVK